MNNFTFITPENYIKHCKKHNHKSDRTLEELRALTNAPNTKCINCDENVWKLAETNMCFSCVTGESDASNDFEIR